MAIPLDRIHLFITIAKHLSITRAAREVHLTQPAVSRQLKLLQEDYGATFIRKTGRGIELTSAGHAFLKEVIPIMARLDELKNAYGQRETAGLTLAASRGPSNYLLPALMTQFSQQYPAAKLTLHTGSSSEMQELLLNTQVELAITTNSSPPSSSLSAEQYTVEPLVAFVAANQRWTDRTSLQTWPLAVVPLILRVRRDGGSNAEAQLSAIGITGTRFRVVMRCESAESVKELVRKGAGIGILYNDLVRHEIERGEFRVVEIDGLKIARQTYILYSKHKPLSSLGRAFLSLLRASIKQELPMDEKASQLSKRASPAVRRLAISDSKLSWWIVPIAGTAAFL